MRFSVALNAYNRADHISETLTAILAQSHPAAEIIVMDDGSTDDTADAVKRFAPAVRYERMENAGSGLSRQAAIDLANHDWIATCDSDDVWHSNHLENLTQALSESPKATFAFSNFTVFGDGETGYDHFSVAPPDWWRSACIAGSCPQEPLRRLGNDTYLALLEYNPVFPSCLVAKASAYKEIGGANPVFSRLNGEDSDITRRLSLTGPAVADSRISVSIRKHANNKSASLARNLYGRYHVLEQHVREIGLPEHLANAAALERDKTIVRAFKHACWEGQAELAKQCRSLLPTGSTSAIDKLRYLRVRALGLTGLGRHA